MTKVLAVIGARLNSSRLPRKHLLDLAGQPLIERLWCRLAAVNEIDQIVLATTQDSYNAPLVAWAAASNRKCYAHNGDVNDLVGRIDAVVQQYQPQMVLYVCGDSPLIEPRTLSRLIAALATQPQALGAKLDLRDGQPAIHEGFDLYSAAGWRLLVESADQAFLREHVGSSLRHRHDLQYAMTTDDAIYYEREHRLSVDTASDYRFMKTVYERWYSQHDADQLVELSWVIAELQRDPQLANTNAMVKQRAANERTKAVLLVSECGSKAGMGHLKRMLVLAAGLQDALAAGVHLLIAGGGVHPRGIDLVSHRFVSPLHLQEETATALLQQPDIVVFDVRSETLASPSWRDWLAQKPWGQATCVAVDGCFINNDLADLVLIPAFYLEDRDPRKHLAHAVHGWPYMLIESVHPNTGEIAQAGVLVLSGGSDVDGWGKVLPELLERDCPKATPIHWVRGPFADAPCWVAEEQLSWRISQAPDHLYPLMQQARFAICQYGVSLFESLAHGLATVAVIPKDFAKAGEVRALQEQGLALVAANPEEAVAQLCRLLEDEDLANQLSNKARAHLDGEGGKRSAKLIEDYSNKV